MSKREEIDDVVWKMEKGLAVMAEATSDSEKLKSAVTELQIAASEKQEEYEVCLGEIEIVDLFKFVDYMHIVFLNVLCTYMCIYKHL